MTLALTSTVLVVGALIALKLATWPVAISLALAVPGLQARHLRREWQQRAQRRRFRRDVVGLRNATRMGLSLLILHAVRAGHDCCEAIAERVPVQGKIDVVLDELVRANLLSAGWQETASQPILRFTVTPAGLAIVSRTLHP